MSNYLELVNDDELRLRLPEVSKTEVERCSGRQKTSPEAESLWDRYSFVRRRNDVRPVVWLHLQKPSMWASALAERDGSAVTRGGGNSGYFS
ncbi:hypothetical protein PanWU01x14_133190 [Parasponia andersonii]|uniref:Uncharacterized protein n=1 Tax=Parasponia andersonii TaxID=3476 RepID=A0A2P5CQC3_PARAD|nr:hypothetical protein PanWU01x14_133190 [Parasponia andersonii]